MSKPISSYPVDKKREVVMRRLKQRGERGLGFWAAVDAAKHFGINPKSIIEQSDHRDTRHVNNE